MSELNSGADFGIDLGSMDIGADALSLAPPIVPGRVLQLDGDMLAYNCGANDEDTLADCTRSFMSAVESRRVLAGADCCIIHLSGNNKGGRAEIALVKEYQGNRKDKAPPKNLRELRAWIQKKYQDPEGSLMHGGNIYCKMHPNQEADDGMAQGQFRAIKNGYRHLSVIMSGDKDLGMCSGLHCDWWTFQMQDVHGFGSCELDSSGSSTKVRGKGTSFFWHQLLMGDQTDGIPGLPKLGAAVLNKYKPSKAIEAAQAALASPLSTPAQREKAHKALAERKPALVGPALAFEVLRDCQSDSEALLRCIEAYQSHYGTVPFDFVDWRGNSHRLTSGHMLLEQARLLWMRRVPNECPTTFFKSVIEGCIWDGTSLLKEVA